MSPSMRLIANVVTLLKRMRIILCCVGGSSALSKLEVADNVEELGHGDEIKHHPPCEGVLFS